MPRRRYWTVVQYVLDARRTGGMLVAFANHLIGPARCRVDGCQQGRFLQGLLEALTDAGASSLLECCGIPVRRDQYCRNVQAGANELPMKVEAGHFRHSQVDD